MNRLLLGLIGAWVLALVAESLGPATFAPRPWLWALVILAPPPLLGLLLGRSRTEAAGWAEGATGARRAPRAPPWHFVLLLAYGVVLFPLGWGSWVLDHLAWRGSPARAFPLLLAPAAVLGLWLSPWVHGSDRMPPEGFAPWLAARARFFLVPTLAFLAVRATSRALEAIPGLEHASAAYPSASLALLVLAAMASFGASPWLFRLAWPSSPFPEGALRERLARVLESSGARLGGLRVWRDPAGRTLNAWTVGVLPGTCQIFFTGTALERLGPDEITAMFCHELAHVRRHHLACQMLLAAALLLLFRPALALTAGLPVGVQGGILALLGAFGLRRGMGWFSRWMELEADVLGARAAGAERYLKVLRGGLPAAGGARGDGAAPGDWRHFSMEKRALVVEESAKDDRRFQALLGKCRWVRRLAILAFLAAVAIFSTLAAGEILAPETAVALKVARSALARAGELRPLVLEPPAGWAPSETGPLGLLSRSRKSIEKEYRLHLEAARRALAAAAVHPGREADAASEQDSSAREKLSGQLNALLREPKEDPGPTLKSP